MAEYRAQQSDNLKIVGCFSSLKGFHGQLCSVPEAFARNNARLSTFHLLLLFMIISYRCVHRFQLHTLTCN